MNKPELVTALTAADFEPYRMEADRIRYETFGNYVDIRAILEYSNNCARECKYCGLNSRNNKLIRYRLSDEEIINTARKAYSVGYKTIVLQGGEDPQFTPDRLANIVREIVKSGMIVTLSSGEMSENDYRLLKDSGATRYLLKHETANAKIYDSLHGDYRLSSRIECLRAIKRLGYETGSGFMIGLPNQTPEVIAEDILLLRELGCDMAGIGPFIPSADTDMRNVPRGSVELTKRAVALARIDSPNILLPATTSLHVSEGGKSANIFEYGANVIMRKVTPTKERALYEIYPSESRVTDIAEERKEVENYLISVGRIPR